MKKLKKLSQKPLWILWGEPGLFQSAQFHGVFTSWQKARAYRQHRKLTGARWKKIELDPSKFSLSDIVMTTLRKRARQLKMNVTANNPMFKMISDEKGRQK